MIMLFQPIRSQNIFCAKESLEQAENCTWGFFSMNDELTNKSLRSRQVLQGSIQQFAMGVQTTPVVCYIQDEEEAYWTCIIACHVSAVHQFGSRITDSPFYAGADGNLAPHDFFSLHSFKMINPSPSL